MDYLRKLLHITLGSIFVILGVLGMIFPIVHGTVFLIIGVIILSFESVTLENKILSLVKKYPKLDHLYEKFNKKLRRLFRK
ncbi:MAG: hypothetical protein RI935_12 [Candidatus Parcubacteria bacterium]|jgi:uncharacterized membrane protein YbaN (DUF454 family)